VVATDALGNKSQQSVTLAVNDVDENAPVFTSGSTATAASIAENSGAGQLVYTAAAIDASQLSFSLAGADAAAFSIDALTGKVTLTGNPDYETKASYNLSVVGPEAKGNQNQQDGKLAVNDGGVPGPGRGLRPPRTTPGRPGIRVGSPPGIPPGHDSATARVRPAAISRRVTTSTRVSSPVP